MQSSTVNIASALLTNSCSQCSEQKMSGYRESEYRSRRRPQWRHDATETALASAPTRILPTSSSVVAADFPDIGRPRNDFGVPSISEETKSCFVFECWHLNHPSVWSKHLLCQISQQGSSTTSVEKSHGKCHHARAGVSVLTAALLICERHSRSRLGRVDRT
jgi:hypothetical protein